jgi:prevent-host-death family protein
VANVSIRNLRKHGGDVVDRGARGEQVTITRAGKPVALLSPIRQTGSSATALLERWHRLPRVDPASLRVDIDGLLDPRP